MSRKARNVWKVKHFPAPELIKRIHPGVQGGEMDPALVKLLQMPLARYLKATTEYAFWTE
jgi:hypothetical protein